MLDYFIVGVGADIVWIVHPYKVHDLSSNRCEPDWFLSLQFWCLW